MRGMEIAKPKKKKLGELEKCYAQSALSYPNYEYLGLQDQQSNA